MYGELSVDSRPNPWSVWIYKRAGFVARWLRLVPPLAVAMGDSCVVIFIAWTWKCVRGGFHDVHLGADVRILDLKWGLASRWGQALYPI